MIGVMQLSSFFFKLQKGEKSQAFKFHVANFGDLSFGIESVISILFFSDSISSLVAILFKSP